MALPALLVIQMGVINMVVMGNFAYIVALQVPVLLAPLGIPMGVTKDKYCESMGAAGKKAWG